jgi:hypothetical protein
MSTVNYSDPKVHTTVKVFDRFYTFEIEVPVDQYDAVLSYFNRTFKDILAAKNFTVSLFQVADYSKRPVMDILAEIQGQDQLQLSATLCYYLNNQRSNATLLGINALVTPNFYAARNVLP